MTLNKFPKNQGRSYIALTHRACSLGNIEAGVQIGIRAVPAFLALKQGLPLPVALAAMPAPAARLGRVTRVNRYHRNTAPLGLVGQVGTEQVVRPKVMQVTGFLAALGGTVTNPGQILNRYGVARLQAVHDAASHDVKRMLNETCFLAAEPLPSAFKPFGAFAVKFAAKLRPCAEVTQPNGLQFAAREPLARRERGKDFLPEVNSQHLACRVRGARILELQSQVDIPLARLVVDELPTLTRNGGANQVPLIVPDVHGDFQTARCGGQGNIFSFGVHGQGALIVGDAAHLEATDPAALPLAHTGDGLHGEVGRQPHVPQDGVGEVVQFEAPELGMLTGQFQRRVAPSREKLSRRLQGFCLNRVRLELAFDGQHAFHKGNNIMHIPEYAIGVTAPATYGGAPIPPTVKTVGFLGAFL